MADKILIAEIVGVHGIKGWVKLRSFAAHPGSFKTYKSLLDKNGRAFEIKDLRTITLPYQAKIKGIDDRNIAEMLKGTKLYITRDQLPPTADNEYYHEDMVGLAVHDTDNNLIGKITAVQNYGAGDILEINTGTENIMLPFTSAIIRDVNISNQTIVVEIPVEIDVKP